MINEELPEVLNERRLYKALLYKRGNDVGDARDSTRFRTLKIITPNPIELELETFSTEVHEFREYDFFAITSSTLRKYFRYDAHWIKVANETRVNRRGIDYKAYWLDRVVDDDELEKIGFLSDEINDWNCDGAIE